MITYEHEEIGDSKTVKVTYKNENNETYEKIVNVPRNSDGTVDMEYFQNILEGQLLGIQHKLKLGVISFDN